MLSATFASSLARAEGRCRHRPLVAAANRRDRAHGIVAALVTELGRELVIPGPVLVEVDQLLRARVGAGPARLFLDAIAAGEHPVAFLSAGLMRRAIEIDARFADLDLGLVDGCVWRSSGSSPALCGSRAASVPCASRGSDLAEVGWGVNIVLVRLRGEWRIVELGFVYP